METKKIGDATTVTTVANGDKIVGVNAAGAMQTIEPVKMLASLLGKATATSNPATTLYVPLVDANGNQQKVSIADLAAVVSGVTYKGFIAPNADINSLEVGSLWLKSSTSTNVLNSPTQNSCFIETKLLNSTFKYQFAYDMNGAVYYRVYWSTQWTIWKTL